MEEAYLGIDIGSISTKGVIINKDKKILSSAYIWTEGDPVGSSCPETSIHFHPSVS